MRGRPRAGSYTLNPLLAGRFRPRRFGLIGLLRTPFAATPAQLAVELGLTEVRDRKYHVQECSVLEGRGIEEGLKWLADACLKPGK